MADKTTDSVDRLGLPPATSLVELALTPFKNYRNSRRTADMEGTGVRAAAGGVGAGATNSRSEMLPPVVKLIVSLLGFESVGPAPPTATSPGQRTLRNMLWLEKGTTAAVGKGSRWNESHIPNEAASPQPSGKGVSGGKATAAAAAVATPGESAAPAEIVAPSPVARVVPIGSLSRSDLPRKEGLAIHCSKIKPRNIAEHRSTMEIDIRQKVAEGSVLIRCPRCKACLPVGETWDAHRDEHMSSAGLPDSHETAEVRLYSRTPSTECHAAMLLPSSETKASSGHLRPLSPPQPQPPPALELIEATGGAQKAPGGANLRQVGGDFEIDNYADSSKAAVAVSTRGGAADSSDGDDGDGRWEKRKLSDLLMVTVTPQQAANVLKECGFIRDDGQTRFANLGLVEDSFFWSNSKSK